MRLTEIVGAHIGKTNVGELSADSISRHSPAMPVITALASAGRLFHKVMGSMGGVLGF